MVLRRRPTEEERKKKEQDIAELDKQINETTVSIKDCKKDNKAIKSGQKYATYNKTVKCAATITGMAAGYTASKVVMPPLASLAAGATGKLFADMADTHIIKPREKKEIEKNNVIKRASQAKLLFLNGERNKKMEEKPDDLCPCRLI